ncbi:Holliday junction branch migration protein RuvA [Candidatus Saccharibacteria bacterium]|nr:Holliday junction branch migration protein RuvA [Candidatus Saccharibacteria bacterium]
MIATLRGQVTKKTTNIVIECAGVGYGVTVSLSDIEVISNDSETKLYIYEHIKEDAHDLYGFLHETSKQLFEQLLSVKNIGPKAAMAILDIGTNEAVRNAIAGGDVKYLQLAKGVGKRAAEQVVVELRDKVGATVGDGAENLVHRSGVNANDEALQALVSLGYTESDAQNVTTAISVAHARGVAMLVGKQADLKIAEYTPLQIKQSLTGYGRATKQQVQEMVKISLGLQEVPKPDDCADALAAAIMHSNHR